MSITAALESADTASTQIDARLLRTCKHAAAQACQSIAPVWPLDQSIAVNPYHQRTGRPVREIAARMAVFAGIHVFPPRAYFRQAWQEGRIHIHDLDQALKRLNAAGQDQQPADYALNTRICIQALTTEPTLPRLPLLMDVLDDDPGRHSRLNWRQAITHQISQTCAAYFDQDQADWQPDREQGLYAFWRETLHRDHGIGILMGLPDLGEATHTIAPDAETALTRVLQRIGLPEPVWADYFEAVLLTINGWASWCAYLGWQARLREKNDDHLHQLLAIRLAWGALLLECKSADSSRHAFAAMRSQWARASDALQQADRTLRIDEIWQTALDISYQRKLLARLSTSPLQQPATETQLCPAFQAVFCIDVRSEPMRRAIEAVNPHAQTIGFAGFFGMPVSYTPAGTATGRAQLPGLFAPSMSVTDRMITPGAPARPSVALSQTKLLGRRHRNFALRQPWQAASHWPSAAFSFVETLGITYVRKLSGWLLPSESRAASDDLNGVPSRYRSILRPVLATPGLDTKVSLAAGILKAMGLLRFAPVVLLVGHESQSANNAHACSLDCGACGGQSGRVNARALAGLLNEYGVREGLKQLGIDIPEHTAFVPAVHNTTTDEITCFDLDLMSEPVRQQSVQIQKQLRLAGNKVRAERSGSLGLDACLSDSSLLKSLRHRANDGAQTRPEWGLTGNAAIIFGGRELTRNLNLEGRVFLHDYNRHTDPQGSTLETLLTGPLMVACWINWQYHASTSDPDHMGSGNKVLHNVVGGRIGVFEGNGGDLRIGLPRQSLHDGTSWRHEPVRLTVVVDAPREHIDTILHRHTDVANLLAHQWVHLWQRDPDGSIHRYMPYQREKWIAMTT